jgi:hypothetical protein
LRSTWNSEYIQLLKIREINVSKRKLDFDSLEYFPRRRSKVLERNF